MTAPALSPLAAITKTVELNDGSTLFWLDNGHVWIIHPVTGADRLVGSSEVAAS